MDAIVSFFPINTEHKKLCRKCGESKPLSEFYKNGTTRKGIPKLSCSCSKCDLAKVNERHIKFHDVILSQRRRRLKVVYDAGICSELYRKQKLMQIKHRSKDRNHEFNLTIEDIIIPQYCPALGIKLNFNMGKADWDSPSVDRIDNDKGYVKGNVVVVSKLANSIKSRFSIEQLKAVADFYTQLKLSKDGAL